MTAVSVTSMDGAWTQSVGPKRVEIGHPRDERRCPAKVPIASAGCSQLQGVGERARRLSTLDKDEQVSEHFAESLFLLRMAGWRLSARMAAALWPLGLLGLVIPLACATSASGSASSASVSTRQPQFCFAALRERKLQKSGYQGSCQQKCDAFRV